MVPMRETATALRRARNMLAIGITVVVGLTACRETATPPAAGGQDLATPTAVPVQPTDTPEPEATPRSAARPGAVFEDAPCPFELPPGQAEGVTVDCGFLVVPENRANVDSRDIRLAVAVLRHPEGAPEPDPIIYLEGGPGGSALKTRIPSLGAFFQPMFEANRDIIVLDQRGVGLSEPALDCPEYTELYLDLLDFEVDGELLDPQERLDLEVGTFLACAERLSAVADLSAYNTAANAADVNDLRIALGYDKVNLWGGSYGTRLALEVMRDFPEGVRSAVLDAPYTPEVDIYVETPSSFDRSLAGLAEECSADPACNGAYPNLRAVFVGAVEALNQSPASLSLLHPLTGDELSVLVDGDGLAELMFRSLYDTAMKPVLPQAIYEAAEGTVTAFSRTAAIDILRQELIRSWGMYFSVLCNEEIPYSATWEEFEAALAGYPEFAGFFASFEVGGLAYRVCPEWGAGKAHARENEPIVSEIPALVLTGQFDPIVPPGWGQQAAQMLTNGYFYEFPGVGHGVSGVECPHRMVLAFLEDPIVAPDASCIAEMEVEPFVVPATAADVELVPYTNEDLGFSAIVPDGWTEVQPGVFARASSAVDLAVLQLAVVPLSAAELPAAMAENYGLDEPLESTGERDANGLAWVLYSFEVAGVIRDLAAAGDGEVSYLVVVRSTPDERDVLFEAVFLPIIGAFVPTSS